MKRVKITAIIASFCLLILLGATAYGLSAGWKILKPLDMFTGVKSPPETPQTLQAELTQIGGETEAITFTVRQAVCDGAKLSIEVEARPKEPDKVLLMGNDASPSDLFSSAGLPYSRDTRTYAQAAAAQKKQMLHVSMDATVDGDSMIDASSYHLEEDGTLVFQMSGICESKARRITVICPLFIAQWDEDETLVYDSAIKDHLAFPLNITAMKELKDIRRMQSGNKFRKLEA